MTAGRRLVAAALAVVAVSAGWGAWALLRPGPPRAVEVTIPRGAAVTTALGALHEAGLLPSVTAGRAWLAVAGRGRALRWGRYRFPPGTRPVDALRRVLEGRIQTVRVTIPEGLTARETAERMAAAGIGTAEEWREAVADPEPVAGLAPEARTLEGFLFPDTYRFAPGTSARRAARHLVRRFLEVWREETRDAPPLWGTPYEVVTLASLVQAESGLPEELPVIAGVYRNRLRRGMLLQCDPTVIYALERRGLWRGRLLHRDLAIDDPYNTYRYPGLPPGPILSPGRLALRAAIEPAETRYLYFVARPEGGHAFSATLREHNRAVARLRRARRR